MTTRMLHLPSSILHSFLLKLSGVTLLSYALGDAIFGLSGGIIAASVGGATAIAIEMIRSLNVRRKDRLDIFKVVDITRDKLAEQSERVHLQEVEFLRKQLSYKEQLEVISRNRMHRTLNEVQRCVIHIRTLEDGARGRVEFVPFVVKTYEDIVGEIDLPVAPTWTGSKE
jgi:hypothetical protein